MCSVCSKTKHVNGGTDGNYLPITRLIQNLSTKDKYYYSFLTRNIWCCNYLTRKDRDVLIPSASYPWWLKFLLWFQVFMGF